MKSYCYFLVLQDLLELSSVEVWVRAIATKCGPCDGLPELLEKMHRVAILELVECEDHLLLAQTWIFEIPLIGVLRDQFKLLIAKVGAREAHESWKKSPPTLATHLCKVHAYLWNELYVQLLQF